MYLESIKPGGLDTTDAFHAELSLKRNLRRGMILVGVLVVGLGGLGATLPMASAVVAPGEVTVESRVKRIGHPTGGIISDVLVRDGDHVRKGQILMRLDATVSGANATMTGESVDQLLAREARLIAERDSLPTIRFPATLTDRAGIPAIAALMSEELRIFMLRRQAREGQIAALSQRVRQTAAEIAGYRSQGEAVQDQTKLVNQELVAARELWAKRYTTLQKLNQLERTAVGLRSDAANAVTAAAQARSKIAEIHQQSITIGEDARSQASTELSDVQARLSEVRQRKVAADDVNERNVIRAPEAGVVDKLNYTTIGGVVPTDNMIMEIVPDTDHMIVMARIKISDVDQVSPGLPAALRFSAFNMRTTPEIEGEVDLVSADRVVDDKTGAAFYTVRIVIAPEQLRRLGALKLKPGMPVEAFIRTGERTMLGYIIKPLRDQLQRAFREE